MTAAKDVDASQSSTVTLGPDEFSPDGLVGVKLREGFVDEGEIEFVEGELIRETIDRAGGIKTVLFRPDVVALYPERPNRPLFVCMSDDILTKPGDTIRGVKKRVPSRKYGCE